METATATTTQRRLRRPRRRGSVSVLAMLFMVLFAVMALGFYSSTTMSVQTAANDGRAAGAQRAAESGLEFMKYHLDQIEVPEFTPRERYLDEVQTQLRRQLEGTPNMGRHTVGKSGDVVSVPAAADGYIAVDGTAQFRATLRRQAGEYFLTVTGRQGSNNPLTRAVEVKCTPRQRSSDVFDFAVASKGRVLVTKGGVIGVPDSATAGLMTTSTLMPAIQVTGGTIGGDLAVVGDPNQAVQVTGGSVGGTSNTGLIRAHHIDVVDPPPVFPVFNTDEFRPYATNTYYAGMPSPYVNIRVPAGMNPKFNGGSVIQGIMYIESPNEVEFKGHATIMGMIVFQSTGDDTRNQLLFSGNASQVPLPAGSLFDPLRSITGVGIMAPTANISMTGSADCTLKGSLIASKFMTTGSSNVTIDSGTLMTTSTSGQSAVFSGHLIKFTGDPSTNPPTVGMSTKGYMRIDRTSYREVQQ